LKFFKLFIFDFRPWNMDLGSWDMRLATLNLGTLALALSLVMAVAVGSSTTTTTVVLVVDDDVVVNDDVVHGLWTSDLGPWSLDFGH
jgi:hypothetical protein